MMIPARMEGERKKGDGVECNGRSGGEKEEIQ